VFYSGHGVNVDGIDYLVPHNGTADFNRAAGANVALDQVVELMLDSGFPRVMLFLDTCRNPIYTGTRSMIGFSQNLSLPVTAEIKVMFSAKAGQVSIEDDKLGHGVFSYFLLEGLRGAAADLNGRITFGDLEKYIHGKMSEYHLLMNTRAQKPVTAGEGSSGMLITTVEPPRADAAYLAQQLRFRGNDEYERRKFADAVASYEAALSCDPADQLACFNLDTPWLSWAATQKASSGSSATWNSSQAIARH